MTTITVVLDPPLATDNTATFNTKAFALVLALNSWASQVNTVAGEINATIATVTGLANAASSSASSAAGAANLASNYAAAAANSAAAAGTAGGAPMWVSGTFTAGDCRWSPSSYLTYRCKTSGSRTTDPALDPTNWQLLSSPAVFPVQLISANTSCYNGINYVLTASVALTFPANPNVNDSITVTDLSNTGTATINPNGQKFNGDATTMTLNIKAKFWQKTFIYTGTTYGWI